MIQWVQAQSKGGLLQGTLGQYTQAAATRPRPAMVSKDTVFALMDPTVEKRRELCVII